MAGFLLARAGIPVVVLEKHADFLRDFRGDTIHPSTWRSWRSSGSTKACCAAARESGAGRGQFGPQALDLRNSRGCLSATPTSR